MDYGARVTVVILVKESVIITLVRVPGEMTQESDQAQTYGVFNIRQPVHSQRKVIIIVRAKWGKWTYFSGRYAYKQLHSCKQYVFHLFLMPPEVFDTLYMLTAEHHNKATLICQYISVNVTS